MSLFFEINENTKIFESIFRGICSLEKKNKGKRENNFILQI